MQYKLEKFKADRISNVEFMLLQILCQQGELSGYRINKIVEEREYRVWTDIGITSIYTGLEKLRKKRLVTPRIDVSKLGKGPLPKKFQITKKGQQVLKKEIEYSLSYTRERDRRFDLALVAIPLLSLQVVINALEKRKHFLRDSEKQISVRFEALGGEKLPINIKALFKHSLHLIKHELEFVNKLIADLKKALSKKEA
jgi:DNA-binding PadR family transcriptional regulator